MTVLLSVLAVFTLLGIYKFVTKGFWPWFLHFGWRQ